MKSDCTYGFLVYGMFFAVFLGINSDKFHYNSVSSKGTAIFSYTKKSDIWQLTWYIMYNKNDHKVLKNCPKNKNYTTYQGFWG